MKRDNKFINNLIKQMSLEEKIGQLYQTGYYSEIITGPSFENNDVIRLIKEGKVGSIINSTDPVKILALQKVAVEQSRLHIPLMFMFDVIHGYKTVFPTPLAMSCSFDDKAIEKACRIAAYEASHSGISLTFSPMLDYVSDARWGRVNESNGEDPYLNTRLSRAYVKGYQGKSLLDDNTIAACAKHYCTYGAVLAGREYSSCEVSDVSLYQKYLPAFKQAIDDGICSIMYAFHSVNNQPAMANKELAKDILRDELKFEGMSITDYGALQELVNHKIAKDAKDASRIAIKNGVDHEMVSTCYLNNLKELCNEDNSIIKYVDESCYRVLKLKYDLGLFTNPYKYICIDNEQYFMKNEFVSHAYKMALESTLLLKNDKVLPIDFTKKVYITGPYKNEHALTGPWSGISNENDTKTIFDSFKDRNVNIVDNPNEADYIIACLGELNNMSGEGASRVELNLPKDQEKLLDELNTYNKKIITVIFAGRPLVLTPYLDKTNAIIYSFYLGLEGGKAIADLILGNENFTAKTTMSFPLYVGQLPLTYQQYPTGRPKQGKGYVRYVSNYIDAENEPLYTFSEGLSYNEYEYSNIKLSKNELHGKKDSLIVSFDVTNKGNYDSDEIAFMFIEAKSFSVIRPYNELKNYTRVHINKNETKHLEFKVNYKTLAHFNLELKNVCEDGIYYVKIGSNVNNTKQFEIKYLSK